MCLVIRLQVKPLFDRSCRVALFVDLTVSLKFEPSFRVMPEAKGPDIDTILDWFAKVYLGYVKL